MPGFPDEATSGSDLYHREDLTFDERAALRDGDHPVTLVSVDFRDWFKESDMGAHECYALIFEANRLFLEWAVSLPNRGEPFAKQGGIGVNEDSR